MEMQRWQFRKQRLVETVLMDCGEIINYLNVFFSHFRFKTIRYTNIYSAQEKTIFQSECKEH